MSVWSSARSIEMRLSRHGEWVVGPDGRRELDVLIEGTVDGVPKKVLVECKDFNPKTTGPVGIGFVDALESEHRDLGVDASFICRQDLQQMRFARRSASALA